jgi:fatty-acid desaturase
MWLVTGLGLTVGYHRLFTHRAFSAGVVTSCILIIMGSMAGRGPMLSWVAMHRNDSRGRGRRELASPAVNDVDNGRK